jgi:hypothetical protein
VTALAGTAGISGSADGTGPAARFDFPTGVAVDSAENVYVADELNSTIRKVTPTGITTTVAGTAGMSGILRTAEHVLPRQKPPPCVVQDSLFIARPT